MDKKSYALGMNMGMSMLQSGIREVKIDDFAAGVAAMLEGKIPALSMEEAGQVLDKFYQGRPDEKTLEILNIRLPDGPVRHDAGKPEIHMENASPDFRSCPGLSGKPRC